MVRVLQPGSTPVPGATTTRCPAAVPPGRASGYEAFRRAGAFALVALAAALTLAVFLMGVGALAAVLTLAVFLMGVGGLAAAFRAVVRAAGFFAGGRAALTESMLALSTSIRSTTLVDAGRASVAVTISFTLALRLDDGLELQAVGVLVLLRVPVALHRLEQQLGHLRPRGRLTSAAPGNSGSSLTGDRISSAKYIVSSFSTSSSGRMATGYSLFRITTVPMATLLAFRITWRRRA